MIDAAQVQPVRKRVQPRERHVGGADLERDDEVREPAEREWPCEQVEHQAPVHREELVVGLVREERALRRRELDPDHEGHAAGDEEHDQRRDHVVQADDLVVGARQPQEDPSGPLVTAVITVVVALVTVVAGRDGWGDPAGGSSRPLSPRSRQCAGLARRAGATTGL